MNAVVGRTEELAAESASTMNVNRSSCLTTTLYDLIDALQATVKPDDDGHVVETVMHWLQSGRLVPLGGNNWQPALYGHAGNALKLTRV